jgi:hypothetical protein
MKIIRTKEAGWNPFEKKEETTNMNMRSEQDVRNQNQQPVNQNQQQRSFRTVKTVDLMNAIKENVSDENLNGLVEQYLERYPGRTDMPEKVNNYIAVGKGLHALTSRYDATTIKQVMTFFV